MADPLSSLSFVRLFIYNGCIVAKWCNIEPRLLLITNRKSHTDLGGRYTRFSMKNWPYLGNGERYGLVTA